ncbi:hypothetical protein OIU76_017120 [Salix suchowensis]|nr:hypothetical protein OIU76_017120 [Salix suchowensis]
MVRDISKLIAFAQLPVNTKAEVLWSAAPFAFLDVSVLKRGQFFVGLMRIQLAEIRRKLFRIRRSLFYLWTTAPPIPSLKRVQEVIGVDKMMEKTLSTRSYPVEIFLSTRKNNQFLAHQGRLKLVRIQ